jgi:hypothetical protein
MPNSKEPPLTIDESLTLPALRFVTSVSILPSQCRFDRGQELFRVEGFTYKSDRLQRATMRARVVGASDEKNWNGCEPPLSLVSCPSTGSAQPSARKTVASW